MKIRLAAELQSDSIVDGEGIRTVIWTQGCSHKCLGCHNPGTHDFNGGAAILVDEIKKELKSLKNQNGITLSGGDPMFQVDACTELAKYTHQLGMDVWCYTGFTFEELIRNEKQRKLLEHIDVLIDGKFDIKQFSFNLHFKGSRNQRIIDVKQSLEKQRVVLVEKYAEEKSVESIYKKQEYMFI